jgi:uncharacterized phage protein gp47/JayE
MADQFSTPTPQQLRDNWDAEVEANFPDAQPKLQKSFFKIFGRGVTLLTYGLYIFLRELGKGIFVTLSFGSRLDRHGSEYNLPRGQALAATGDTIATGTNTTPIPAGARLKSEGGILYEVVTGQVIAGGTATLPVRALTFGADTNRVSGEILTFITPIAGVTTATTVDTPGLVGGADRELDDPYRRRILFKKRNPIQGGSLADYILWGLMVADVTRVFPVDQEDGPCTVKVRFMMDDKYADGIPAAGDVTVVQDFINTLKPAGIAVTVEAPVAQPQAFDITIVPNNADVQLAVTNAIKDLIIREAKPGGTIPISKIRQTVSNAVGESDNTVNTPAGDITAATADDIITLTEPITFS